MAKPVVRAYPEDVEQMAWTPVTGVGSGAREKVLALDTEDGSMSRYLKVEAGGALDELVHDRWEETYVVEGSFSLDGRRYAAGSYRCSRPGDRQGRLESPEGFVAFQARDFNDAMDKPTVSLTAEEIEAMPWERIPYRPEGFDQKLLATGPSGSLTAIGRIVGGATTTEPDVHDFLEEVLIFSGSCTSVEAGTYGPGAYTCFPPKAPDGPYVFDDDMVCLELKNYW